VILRLRAAFSALTGDPVRGVFIVGCRAGALLGVLASGQGRCCQPGWGKARSVATAAATVAAQGQRRSSRSWVRRPDRVRRPAMASSRRRSVLGSATRSGPDNDSVWVEVSRSQARRTMASQTALDAAAWSGRLARPMSLTQRMRSSARARRWCRGLGSGSCPPLVLVGSR
jgi:hypothetical protein